MRAAPRRREHMLKLPEKQCAPQELNNLNRPRSGAVTSKAGNMQRVGGPVAHYACRLPSKTLLVLRQSLSVEHVALDNQGNDSEACVAPGRQGASALACRGADVLQQSTGKQSGRYPSWHSSMISLWIGYSSQDCAVKRRRTMHVRTVSRSALHA